MREPALDRTLLLLRYVLIVATGQLLLAAGNPSHLPHLPHLPHFPAAAALLVLAGLASNVALVLLPLPGERVASLRRAILIADAVWIALVLLLSRRFGVEFFALYFLLLLLGARGESLATVSLSAVAACAAYAYAAAASADDWSIWGSQALARLPFLFTTAVYSGVLAGRDRARQARPSAETVAPRPPEPLPPMQGPESAARIKSEFLASMSSELRQSLEVVIGYIDLLLDSAFGAISPQQADVLERMARSSRELVDMIQAMLDLSRLEISRVPVRLADVRIADLIEELEGETRRIRQGSELSFEWSVAPNLPRLLTDRVKLKMVLRSLIGNAMKFTERGSVTVRSEAVGEGVAIAVTDSGAGIPPEVRTIIFEPPGETDEGAAVRRGEGGVGLYIAHRLLQVLGGTVDIESDIGRGTTFTVWLPLEKRGSGERRDESGPAAEVVDAEASPAVA